MSPSLNRTQLTLSALALFIAALMLAACEMRFQIPSSTDAPDLPKYEFEATGEDFLISALEEVQAIADWSDSFQNGPDSKVSDSPPTAPRMVLARTATDTVYIYGQIIAGGYGAVVTERYARPKGLLLITVRKTYGKGNGHIVTETKRYATYADHRNDRPQQTNVTEMYGCQTDTIVAHVLRDGTLQTYTFRLPVVTRVINPQDGSVRVTKRYASNGAIVSKVEDANSNLVQLSRSYGQSDGSTVSRTEYPDGSWRQVRTHGEADRTITRETTSGIPSLGSGNLPPTNIPRPVMSLWMSPQSGSNSHSTNPGETIQDIPFLASGVNPPVTKPPRPRFTRGDVTSPVSIASGNSACPRPPLPTLASGATMINPKPPLPLAGLPAVLGSGHSANLDEPTVSFTSFASGIAPCPVTPRPAIPRETGTNLRHLASGTPCPPTNIPRPTIAHVITTHVPSLASGQSMPGPVPRPALPSRNPNTSDSERACTLFASGNSVSPPVFPRPVMSLRTPKHSRTEDRSIITRTIPSVRSSLASGTSAAPKPPRPILASGNSVQPNRPLPIVALLSSQSQARLRFTPEERAASGKQSLASGVAIFTPRPPRSILA